MLTESRWRAQGCPEELSAVVVEPLGRSTAQAAELLAAVERGAGEDVEELLCEGVDPNGALCLAARQGHVEVLLSLLEAKADVEGAPLHAAVEGGQRCVELLLEHGCDVNGPATWLGWAMPLGFRT